MELTSEEKLLNEQMLIFKWLKEHRIDFVEIATLYSKFLEEEKDFLLTKNSRYRDLLTQYLEYGKLKVKNKWVKDKAIGTLYAYQEYRTAPIYKEWETIIQENNINTNLDSISYDVHKPTQKEYQHNYYESVTKEKRRKARTEKNIV